MRVAIAVLILGSFMQSSFLPINLVLILLISKSLLTDGKDNFYIAFFSGILLAILQSINIGFYALTFVLFAEALRLLKRVLAYPNPLLVPPIVFLALLILALLEEVFFATSIDLKSLIIQSILSLPVFLIVKLWEERFTPAPAIKLKIK